jgi:hypothetical protein
MSEMEEKKVEADFYKYQGWKIPRVIRLVWTVLILWGVYYFIKYAIPDLQMWLDK